MKRICCIFNFAPHYRQAIYRLMDKELPCDFYFGDQAETRIRPMDVTTLRGYKGRVKNLRLFSHFYWQQHILSLLQQPYDTYLLTGEFYNLSLWAFLFFTRLCHKNKKVYLWTHGWYGRENAWKKFLKKLLFRNANGLFLYGEHARKLMIENGFNPDKLHCIANSLDYDKQKAIRQTLAHTDIYDRTFGNQLPTCIYVGRLQPSKRLDLLIQATSILQHPNRTSCNLLIVGDGDNKSELEDLVHTYKLEKSVRFYGSCYDEKKLAELFYNATACVSPGNVGLTALHAMSFGCPVITHDTFELQMPEYETITENKTGLFFHKDSAEDLARAIEEWLHKAPVADETRTACFETIDKKWNPYYQINVLKQILK